MDVIALSKAMKAKKAIQQLNNRLGDGVQDIHVNVKTRIEAIESKDPKITIYNRVSEVEAKTTANLNKHNLRMNAVINKNRYNMTDLIVDDFGDENGIDKEKSSGYIWDQAAKKIKIDDSAITAEVVTVKETLEADPSMIVVSESGLVKNTDTKVVDFSAGTLVNVEVVNGKIQLKVSSEAGAEPTTYFPSGFYESPVLDLGDNFKSIIKLDQIINAPVGSEVNVFTATSADGVTFSEYQPLNPDGALTSPSARYIKIKMEMTGGSILQEKLVYDFTEEQAAMHWQANDFVIHDGSVKLKTQYQDPMLVDVSFNEAGTLLRKAINKTLFKTIEKIEVI